MIPTRENLLVAFGDRQRAYQLAFADAAGKAVINDLAVFCRANETCLVPGNRDLTSALEGRREVFLRIMDHLNLSTEQLFDRYTRPAQGATSHDDRPQDPTE